METSSTALASHQFYITLIKGDPINALCANMTGRENRTYDRYATNIDV